MPSSFLKLSLASSLFICHAHAHVKCCCSCHQNKTDASASVIPLTKGAPTEAGPGRKKDLKKINAYKAQTKSPMPHHPQVLKSPENANDTGYFRYGFGIGFEQTTNLNLRGLTEALRTQGYFGSPEDNKKNLGFIPHIEIGYQFASGIYLGALITYHYAYNHAEINMPGEIAGVITFVRRRFKTQYNFSALAKIGFKPTKNLLIYGLIGPGYTKWEESSKFYEGGNLTNARTRSYNSTAVKLGLGLEYLINDQFSLSADWTHASHKFNKRDTSAEFGERHSIHSFAFKITYYF